MRAAISHKFGRDYTLGAQPWTENPSIPGTWMGNPSLSVKVSQYMVSLHRRKVREGEVVTSARAIDEGTLKALYEFNKTIQAKGLSRTSRKRPAEHPPDWAGGKLRKMLNLIYVISFLCLLRFDEVLNLQWPDIEIQQLSTGDRVKISLLARKTHQNGGIAPFFLYPNPNKKFICPLTALAEWINVVGPDHMNGYVFRRKVGANSWDANPSHGMSADSFMECFRNNLLDIKIDPRPYGTHSFRRGGCQYLAMVLRWPFRNICSWGGWAENFDNPGTIFKYLLAWTDVETVTREEFMDPNRKGSDPCTSCGRTCWCR
ncbi:hypothetical protein BD410DRAFT_817264 [Rickenella mellea]|uniref:DNA breaking-rejoining enzyme n=1 Tax=Rickenella mellea TaxID=50990 RepID=A0A4Y7PEJ3_9AGAM|nr:hypothetical protein BD410DRAFT_817264 [Rickenella mellea]